MKAILFLLGGMTAAAAQAQSVALHQDPAVKILGNVANNLALPGFPSIPENPQGPRLSWGPRSYTSTGQLLNLSFRGHVGGNATLSGGFVLGGARRVVLIRAVGPSLAGFGVADALPEPRLEVFDASGRSLATAVPWSDTNPDTRVELRAAATSAGAFALREGSKDQVLLMLLDPGAYTCTVSGANASSGAVLVEMYEVPPVRNESS